jgi:chromosome segregation ATPase
MHPIDLELDHLEELYDKLETQLEGQYQDLKTHRVPTPDEKRQAGTLNQQTIEAEKCLARFMHDLEADPQTLASWRSDAASRVALLQARARRLIALIERNSAGLNQLRSAARESLQKLRAGGRFLQSVRGHRGGRPKFIDAHQ